VRGAVRKQTDVSCIEEAAPYADAGREFIAAAGQLADSPATHALRVIVAFQLFHETEAILAGDEDPVPRFIAVLQRLSTGLRNSSGLERAFTALPVEEFSDVKEETGAHYGSLFREFAPKQYYGEATELLRLRFERNGFDKSFPSGKRALDAGCGGGRYTVALKHLGFDEVVGVDYSDIGIAFAGEQVKSAGIVGVRFQKESVLALSFPDCSFDFVFCNGVLHHTVDIWQGLAEVVRVLNHGGRGFLYLIERPGGIFWDVIEILRPVLEKVPYAFARQIFACLGVPANRRYYILDHVMVPINTRTTPEQVESGLRAAGARNIRRLTRGVDFDRAERIYQGVAFAREKFGVGENRYFFEK